MTNREELIQDKVVHLGPRDVVIGGTVVSTLEDVQVLVEEATPEEIEDLKAQPVILLVKPPLWPREETPT